MLWIVFRAQLRHNIAHNLLHVWFEHVLSLFVIPHQDLKHFNRNETYFYISFQIFFFVNNKIILVKPYIDWYLPWTSDQISIKAIFIWCCMALAIISKYKSRCIKSMFKDWIFRIYCQCCSRHCYENHFRNIIISQLMLWN